MEHRESHGGHQEKEGKKEGGQIRGGVKPGETMDSGKHTEGFRGEGAGAVGRPVTGVRRAHTAMSTACYRLKY